MTFCQKPFFHASSVVELLIPMLGTRVQDYAMNIATCSHFPLICFLVQEVLPPFTLEEINETIFLPEVGFEPMTMVPTAL